MTLRVSAIEREWQAWKQRHDLPDHWTRDCEVRVGREMRSAQCAGRAVQWVEREEQITREFAEREPERVPGAEMTRERIMREINYRFPRDHHTAQWEQDQALQECADDILALFAPRQVDKDRKFTCAGCGTSFQISEDYVPVSELEALRRRVVYLEAWRERSVAVLEDAQCADKTLAREVAELWTRIMRIMAEWALRDLGYHAPMVHTGGTFGDGPCTRCLSALAPKEPANG